MQIRFLTLEEIIRLHAEQIEIFGGMHGIRDQGLLESALYEPQASFGGKYLHGNLFGMATAYAYSIIKNHPFIDGNKRTGIMSALLFLDYHDTYLNLTQEEVVNLAITIATTKISHKKIAAQLKKKTILEPMIQVPATEAWLFEPQNKKILAKIKRGLKQDGTISRGSFAKYLKKKLNKS